MLPQLSNIINSYSIYGTVVEYSKTFERSHREGAVCKPHNGIWKLFFYNYRLDVTHRIIYNIEGKFPYAILPENY